MLKRFETRSEAIKKNFGYDRIALFGGIQEYYDYLVELDNLLTGSDQIKESYYKKAKYEELATKLKYNDRNKEIEKLITYCLDLVNGMVNVMPEKCRSIEVDDEQVFIPNDSALFMLQEFLQELSILAKLKRKDIGLDE